MRSDSPALLSVSDLRKTYVQRSGFMGKRFAIDALRGVSLQVALHSTLAIVGESGSGKSTLAKCMAGIESCDSGEIWLQGWNVSALPVKQRFAALRPVQLVFQDSASSLNPMFTAEEIVAEPLRIEGYGNSADRRRQAHHLMTQVGLSPQWARRRPLEFSGGQRQRLAIARALAARPRLIIFDEALCGLDLLTRTHTLQLLRSLQTEYGLTFVHITHDLDLAHQWAEEIVLMHGGKIVSHEISPQPSPLPESGLRLPPVAEVVEA